MAPSRTRAVRATRTVVETDATVSRRRSKNRATTPEYKNDLSLQPGADSTSANGKYIGAVPMSATPTHKFIQRMTCQSLRKNGSDIIQCQSCIERRNDSGGCRFAGFRAFKLLNPNEESSQSSTESVPQSTEPSETPASVTESKRKGESDLYNGRSKKRRLNIYPTLPPGLDYQNYALVGDRVPHKPTQKAQGCLFSTSIPLSKDPKPLSDDDAYIMSKIAPVLGKGLRRELKHEQQTSHRALIHPIIRITEDAAQRSLCDACATTLFIVSYVCHICGREYCPDCYDDWEGECENIRFETCSRNKLHKKQQMVLAVRACEGEIETLSAEMDACIKKLNAAAEEQKEGRFEFKTRQLHDKIFAPVYEFSARAFDEQSFKLIWGLHGRPIVIQDCYERFQLPWDPEYFINNHGHEDCTLVQTCPPFENINTKVAKFFKQFGEVHHKEALKLKDWPPADNFADVFPELMLDFERALPDAVAKHIRQDGVYNLVSRFPDGYNKPDLGPKMYNAFPATVQMDGKLGGTTNLHRDITDAINFMMYATSDSDRDAESDLDSSKDRSPGAIWDIFPIGATVHIRDYLDKIYPNQPTDPLHRQNCYLTQGDLETLYDTYGVQSYRVLQRPGDAIMIPAGCAHQVRNIKDCIKVAVDFLSPENVEICEYLLHENRAIAERANSSSLTKKGKETKKMSRVKKEDVLQLWKCLTFYYTAIREQMWGNPSEKHQGRQLDGQEDCSRSNEDDKNVANKPNGSRHERNNSQVVLGVRGTLE